MLLAAMLLAAMLLACSDPAAMLPCMQCTAHIRLLGVRLVIADAAAYVATAAAAAALIAATVSV
jgi:hypothetical protein